jgi:uncharacterized protein DUF1579
MIGFRHGGLKRRAFQNDGKSEPTVDGNDLGGRWRGWMYYFWQALRRGFVEGIVCRTPLAGEQKMRRLHVKRIVGVIAVCVLLMGISMRAQAPPTPGPEVKRLGYFVGTWKEVGTAHMGAMQGPEGKVTSTTKYEWLAGGFFVVGHSETVTSMGTDKEMSVMGWDESKNVYTYHAFDSEGEADEATGTYSGDTWTWTTDNMGGAPIKARLTIKEVSKSEYTFKMEISQDGNTWTTALETTSTKVVPVTAK